MTDETFEDVTEWAFTDPEVLRERTDVLFERETRVVNDRSAFNGREAWAGMASAGVVNDDGEVLLVNAPDGWTLPVTPVDPGAAWAPEIRAWVAQKTGVAVDVERPERVTRVAYRLADAEHRQTVGYDVVFRATPTGEETAMDYLNAKRASEDRGAQSAPGNRPQSDDDDRWDAAFFDHVPADVEDDSDVVDDVEWFVDA